MVDKTAIEEMFAPFGHVVVKSMFGEYGIYADGIFFALTYQGEVYLKADAASEARFRAAGSKQFIYRHPARGKMPMPYWTLPASALENDDELVDWSRLALEVARRKLPGKKPKAKKAPPTADASAKQRGTTRKR